MVQNVLQVHHKVERRQLGEVERSIAMQDFVIEPQIVETHDKVGALEVVDEVIHGFFVIDLILVIGGAVGDADAHAHFGNVVPAADFIGGALGLQVKIKDVLGHGGTLCSSE